MSLLPERTVLILEDEWLIAELLKDSLESAGFQVCGPVARVAQALELIESARPDAAVLDVSLRREKSFPVARVLMKRAIPFLFMTGYVPNDIPDDFRGKLMLNKPIDHSKLVSSVAQLLGCAAIDPQQLNPE